MIRLSVYADPSVGESRIKMKPKMTQSIDVNNYGGSKVIVMTVVVPYSENNGKRMEDAMKDILIKLPASCSITFPGL